MTTYRPDGEPLPAPPPSERLADLGFLAGPDLPDRPGPAFLLVALRTPPTLRHYDPERIEFWMTHGSRGARACLTRATPLPLELMFSWGLIRLFDRLSVTNEYLTFGGHLSAVEVDGATIAAFTSPVPLLRRGGHSRDRDKGTDVLGAYFARLLSAIHDHPQLEPRLALADPVVRYGVFLGDVVDLFRRSAELRAADPDLWTLARGEAALLERDHPEAWITATAIRADAASPGESVAPLDGPAPTDTRSGQFVPTARA